MNLKFFVAMTEPPGAILKTHQAVETENLPFDPLQCILISAIGVSDNSLAVCREISSTKERTVKFDSGSFFVQTNRMTYDEVLRRVLNVYTKHRWADYYVLPDHIPLSDDDEVVEMKIQDTIKNSVEVFYKLPDELKPKAVPVIHGFYKDQIDRCLEAYLELGVKNFGFGAYQVRNVNPGNKTGLLNKVSIAFIDYVMDVCKQHDIKLHLFGVGAPPYVPMFKGLGVSSFDSTNWKIKASFGAVVFPFTRSYNISVHYLTRAAAKAQNGGKTKVSNEWEIAVLTENDFYRLKEITNHSCSFCESYEKLTTDTTSRVYHNLVSITESVHRINTEDPEKIDVIFQQGSRKYRDDVRKWLLCSEEERQVAREERRAIVERTVRPSVKPVEKTLFTFAQQQEQTPITVLSVEAQSTNIKEINCMRKGLSISPRNPLARPSVQELKRLNVENVRFVFQSHAVGETTDQALTFYTPLISELTTNGIRSVLVINQESHSGAPWINGAWEAYHRDMGQMCRVIAQHFTSRKLNVSYVIWNEGDIYGESSVFYPAEQYGKLLRACFDGIRSVDTHSLIYTQGHANAAPISLQYIQTALRAAGGTMPNLVFNRHPYGQYVGNQPPNIPTGWFGRLQNDLRTFTTLNMPIAIGEIGVSEPRGFPEWSYPNIAQYMSDVHKVCSDFKCTDFIWFGYHDVMRGAGIRDFNNVEKPYIYPTFLNLPKSTARHTLGWSAVVSVNLRQLPSTQSRVIAVIRRGESFQLNTLVECQACAESKVGDENKWIYVTYNNQSGFVNAKFVQYLSEQS